MLTSLSASASNGAGFSDRLEIYGFAVCDTFVELTICELNNNESLLSTVGLSDRVCVFQ